jgi:hypothetical protein
MWNVDYSSSKQCPEMYLDRLAKHMQMFGRAGLQVAEIQTPCLSSTIEKKMMNKYIAVVF